MPDEQMNKKSPEQQKLFGTDTLNKQPKDLKTYSPSFSSPSGISSERMKLPRMPLTNLADSSAP